MIASDYLLPAIKLSLLVVAILWGVDLLEQHTRTFSRGVHARVVNYSQKKRPLKDASGVNNDEPPSS